LAGLALGAVALALALFLGWKVLLAIALYALFNVAYSAGLRREPVLDVLLVSSGFVLRPVAGAFAIPVRVSPWLFVVSLLLSLTLALLKRRAELVSLQAAALDHRPSLSGYSVPFLDLLVAIVTGSGIISYALYTFQSEHGERLVLTLVNRRQVQGSGFTEQDGGGILMDDATRKAVVAAWQLRKQDEIEHPYLNERIPVGLVPYVQALLLARYVRGGLYAYPAFFWR